MSRHVAAQPSPSAAASFAVPCAPCSRAGSAWKELCALCNKQTRGSVSFDTAEQDEGTLVDTAIRMLDVFLAQVPRPEKTLAVEMAFSLELNHPKTGEVLPVPLIGSIDAVVLTGGVGSIWELKTAAKKWSPEQLEHDLQITGYGIAARELGYDGARLEFIVVTKTTKAAVQREVAVRHEADERELVDVVFSVHRAIRAGVDHRARSWACSTCCYAAACRP
ncbi:MAG: PD-(D/E)XK nuclease family protein [Solirubrobacterales bacterium]